jgi:ribonuclease P protein component
MGSVSTTPGAFSKQARLRRDRDFAPVRTRGRRFTGREALVRSFATSLGHARLGLATSYKYGGAVRRNRFRRLARCAFRAVASTLGSVDLLVSPRRDLGEPTLEGIAGDLVAAVRARTEGPRVSS